MGDRRVVVVTGGSSGIGLAAAAALARSGAEVVLLGRHPGRLAAAASRVQAAGDRPPSVYRADFAALDDVRAAADRIRTGHERVDVLVNNAGQLAPWAGPTVDGFDRTMQVNHLAGFLLTHLLLDRLVAAATGPYGPARVVTTGSLAEVWGWLNVDRPLAPQLRYRSRWLAYGASKQANLLFTTEAARRWEAAAVVPTCFFPGLIRSRFGRGSPLFSVVKPLLLSPEHGADTLVWLATEDAALRPGGYFAFRAPMVASPRGTDPQRARRLWRASLAAVGLPDEPVRSADGVRGP